MTIPTCSARSIPVRWPSLGLALLLLSATVSAESVQALARAYAKKPTPAGRAALIRFAAAHGKDESGALALLAVASEDVDAGRHTDALTHLQAAEKRLPKIADYIGLLEATAQYEIGDDKGVAKSLEAVWKQTPESPLAGRAAIVAARSLIRTGKPHDAVDLLKKHYAALLQPRGDLVLAQASEASSDLAGAANYYQSVYYNYPAAPDASDAASSMARLQSSMKDLYPSPGAALRITRGQKLMDAGQYREAKAEFASIVPLVGGAERDWARLRIGVSDYLARNNAAARDYLHSLELATPEADAERLYYALQSSRRLDDTAGMQQYLDLLAQRYRDSRRRMEAIVAAANYYLINNRRDQYEPLYRSCYESFPKENQAAYCHWKVAWAHFMARESDAADLLRTHVSAFPASDKVTAALYFLGREAERTGDVAAAAAWFAEIREYYPNSYYAVLTAARLSAAPALRAASPAPAITTFLRGIAFPDRVQRASFQAGAGTKQRIDRARLLATAGVDALAEGELRFGARTEDQPQVYALELARLASARSAYDQAIRYIKAHASRYLQYPIESAPVEFWKLAFPFPFRDAIVRYSRQVSLDPNNVAALIRQESEFSPTVISHANAYGLTQILPPTGRELARKWMKVRRFRAAMLFQPDVNIQLGTRYLKSLLDSVQGSWEQALASYNAGRRRAVMWAGWAEYREPAEYVESIPIGETRNYIQIIVRNAAIYKILYSPGGSGR